MRWLPQLRALALGHDELQNVQRILRTQPHLYRISGNTTALVLISGTKFSTTQFGFVLSVSAGHGDYKALRAALPASAPFASCPSSGRKRVPYTSARLIGA